MEDEDTFGFWEGQCRACEMWGPVNDPKGDRLRPHAEENMRQAVMTAPGRIEFRDVTRPTTQSGLGLVAADQVLIQVRRIGICGSDIHVFHGRHPYTSYPVVQGHEVAGVRRTLCVVAEVGDQMAGLAAGGRG